MKPWLHTVALLASLWIGASEAAAQGPIAEFTDHDYAYAFQYPSHWKLEKTPGRGEGAGVRVLLRSPAGSRIMVTVGELETSIRRDEFERNPKKDALVQQLLEFTVEQVYKKTSREIGATRMIVNRKERAPSDVGISFYVSTLHILEAGPQAAVVGLSVIPFGKSQLISFTMVTVLDGKAKEEAPTLDRVFRSFHMIGEKPLPNP